MLQVIIYINNKQYHTPIKTKHHDYFVESQGYNCGDGNQDEAAEPEDLEDLEEMVYEILMQVVYGERDVGIEDRQVDVDERTTVTTLYAVYMWVHKGARV